jgi:hypothetical protein
MREHSMSTPADHAIQIATAALEAVKTLPHAVPLGTGDINRIISQTSNGSMSILQRITLAQNMAMETAKAYLDQPKNKFAANAPQPPGQNFAQGWAQGAPYGFGAGRFAGMEGRGTGGSGMSGTTPTTNAPVANSSAYGNIVGNFGVDGRGVLNGYTHQMFNSQFRPLGYNEPTARNVAGILGRSEGLSGAALVARTKEVAQDTQDGLRLDVNRYASSVAKVGKEYSDPLIGHRSLMDEAERLRRSGDYEGANQKREEYFHAKEELRAKAEKKDPKKLAPIDDIHHGMEKSVPGLFNDPSMPQRSREEKSGAYGPSTQDRIALETKEELSKHTGAKAKSGKGFFDDVSEKPEKSISSLPPENKAGQTTKSAEAGKTTEPKVGEKAEPKASESEKTKTAAVDAKAPAPAKGKGAASSPKMT